jgi:Notch-like protein
MDCDGVAPGSDPSEPSGRCNSLYEDYCLANYQNRYCDQGCNNKECGWDGLDCVNTTATTLPGQITFVFNTDFEILKNSNNIDIAQILRKLSFIIPGVVFEKQELKRDAETGKGALDLRVNQAHCDRGHECFKSVIEVEEFLEASQILRNSLSPEALQSHFKISDVRAVDPYYTQEGDDSPSGPPTTPTLGVIVSLSFVLIVCGVIIGVLTGNSGFGSFSGKIKKKRGITWFPEGFTRPTPTGRRDERRTGGAARAAGGDFSIRRGPHMGFPDAQEMHSLSSSTQLMTKESGQIHEQDVMDSDGYARKVATYDSIYDEPNEPRKWAIQHLEAYQGRCPAGQTQIMSPPLYDTLKARTPTTPTSVSSPFGSPGSPLGVGVDVRGPGGLTPLMVASAFDSQTLFCQQSMINGNHYPASPSALLMENNCSSDGQVNSPAPTQSDIIQELINSGASHVMQAELTGETPLHMAARYSRADAAKRLLEAGANPNTEDLKGRTPLHAAIAADARGVFEILLRHRATNLNAQDELGFTPLILAVKNSVEDMIEELIRAEANLDIQDAKGKTALHWAASVNNVSAINHLLNAGANKDAQDNLEQTPLFLAARDGAAQAVKLLLSKGANRDITDHMDKLPRDIAAELLHGDIVRALDEAVPQHSVMYGTSLYGQTMSPPQLPPVNHIRSISHDVDQKPKLANARLTQAKKAAQNRRPSCSSSSSDPTEAENAAKPPRSRHERGSSTLGRVKKSASSNHQRSHSAARATPASNNSNQAPVIPLQQLQPQQLSNNQVMQQQTQFTANFNEPIMVTPGTTTFYGQTMNHGMIGGQGALLSPPSSSSPESSFSPASSHSHALSPHTSVASPYSTSSHVSSPPHHQQYAPMSFPSGPYNGQQHNMVQHHQQNNRHNQGLHQSHQRQHQVPPPAYDEAVYGSNDQVTTFFNMGFPQQVYGQANYHSDQAYLTPSPGKLFHKCKVNQISNLLFIVISVCRFA